MYILNLMNHLSLHFLMEWTVGYLLCLQRSRRLDLYFGIFLLQYNTLTHAFAELVYRHDLLNLPF